MLEDVLNMDEYEEASNRLWSAETSELFVSFESVATQRLRGAVGER